MASFNSKIRLEIISALNDAGIKATAEQLDQLQSKVNSVEANAGTLGDTMKQKFSPMTAISAAMTGNFQTLGLEMVKLGSAMKGVAMSVGTFTGIGLAIGVAVAAVKKLIDVFRSAKEEQAKLAKAANEEFVKKASESLTTLKSDYTEYVDGISKATDAKLKELDATQRLIEAETRRSMLAKGATEDEIKRAQQMSRLKYEQSKVGITEDAAKKAEEYRQKIVADARTQMLGLYARSHDQSAKVQKKLDEMREKYKQEMIGYAGIDYAAGTEPKLSEGQKRRIEAKMRKFKLTDEYKQMWGDYDKTVAEANKAAEFIKTLEAAEVKAKEQTKIAEIEKAEEVAAAAADAIAEQRKMEDIRHAERMKNLEAEANAANSQLDAAKSRFEREFATYKSADKGAAAIEAEKADEEARKQLQKDAARYGGKWRIDELSRLYAAGDEEAVKSTLSQWRKSKTFTPEIESMVRAAAAGENVKTMEDRVAEIAENTKGLADKVDELLTMKGE